MGCQRSSKKEGGPCRLGKKGVATGSAYRISTIRLCKSRCNNTKTKFQIWAQCSTTTQTHVEKPRHGIKGHTMDMANTLLAHHHRRAQRMKTFLRPLRSTSSCCRASSTSRGAEGVSVVVALESVVFHVNEWWYFGNRVCSDKPPPNC
jgi:hypothetical protein